MIDVTIEHKFINRGSELFWKYIVRMSDDLDWYEEGVRIAEHKASVIGHFDTVFLNVTKG
jgi:hypothetical protein